MQLCMFIPRLTDFLAKKAPLCGFFFHEERIMGLKIMRARYYER